MNGGESGPRYIVASDVEPQNIRVDAEGRIWGEVPVILVQGPMGSAKTSHVWSASERSFVSATFVHEIPDDLPGGTLKPDPLEAKTVEEFVDAMRRYRRWAGSPSFRVMADRVGVRSSSRFCEALKLDAKLPTFALLDAFVVALGGTSADFQRWAAAWRSLEGQTPARPHRLPLPSSEETQ